MPVTVRIPTALRNFTDGQATVAVEGANVGDVVSALVQRHEGLGERIRDAEGNLRRFVNLYLNDEDVRFLQNMETAVKDGDEISIIPAIAGGA